MVGTMGVALTVCTVPGQNTSDRLGPGKMELGLGIVSILYMSGLDTSSTCVAVRTIFIMMQRKLISI
jgi:hypothetical protein